MNKQLQLALDGTDEDIPPLPARLDFPLATDGGRPFDDDAFFFEPWWPGAHAFVRHAAGVLELRTEHLSDPLVIFPELRTSLSALEADGVIIEGTLMALDQEGRPDGSLLRRCLRGGTAQSGVAESVFVASDLPYFEGRSLARMPYVERRRRLAAVLPTSARCVLGPGLAGEGLALARALVEAGLSDISARRLDGHWKAGHAGDTWLRLRPHERPSTDARPFLVLLETLPLRD